MLFTEECDKVRDLMHVHSFSYDFHLRLVHQHVVGTHLVLRHGYHLTTFLRHFLAHHPDGPHFGRNHIYQGWLVPKGKPVKLRKNRPQGVGQWDHFLGPDFVFLSHVNCLISLGLCLNFFIVCFISKFRSCVVYPALPVLSHCVPSRCSTGP